MALAQGKSAEKAGLTAKTESNAAANPRKTAAAGQAFKMTIAATKQNSHCVKEANPWSSK